MSFKYDNLSKIITYYSLKEKYLLYIVVALKHEAQAFVDKYKLTKTKLGEYPLFFNDTLKLIISGMGVANARNATQTLINNFDITDADIYINVGICGAKSSFAIGELIEIGNISYQGILHTFESSKEMIVCSDIEVSNNKYSIVDMESFGFYDAVIHNPAIKNFFIFKVVSDHFEPEKVTKESAKKLVFNQIDDINLLLIPKE